MTFTAWCALYVGLMLGLIGGFLMGAVFTDWDWKKAASSGFWRERNGRFYRVKDVTGEPIPWLERRNKSSKSRAR